MSIGSTTNRNDYTGNGAASVYAYGFRITNEDHLLVTVRNTAVSPAETTLVIGVDYTVSGVNNGSGGNITLVDSGQVWLTGGNLTTGYKLTIRRVVPLTQPTDIRNQGSFLPETHENAFDRFVMADQQQQDEIDRSIRLPETEIGTEAATLLPSIEDRSGNFLGFDGSGNLIAVAATVGTAFVSPFMETVLDDTTGPAVLETLRDTLANEASPAIGDEVILYDLSTTTMDKITLANLLKVINGLTAEPSPASGDELVLYDTSAGDVKKVTLSDLAASVAPISIPRWTKYTKAYADFSAAALTNSITLFTAPAGAVIHSVKIKHSTAFSGTGITAYRVGLGIAGALQGYATDFNVFQAVTSTQFQLSNILASEDHGGTWDVKATATSVGANLDAASGTGSVDIWVLISVVL
jgi:hypothetical protein